ncbi:MAG: bifunctional phosphoribosylaminoimidazolecarboxamide formyltransferase/IMP cyclohydrolase [Bacilli bacterium]
MTKKRALISVSDKNGIVAFASKLAALDFEIISTGGTYNLLKNEGLPVLNISEVTGFPEILDGRVKTLHPNIHSGLLAVRDDEEHMRTIAELGIGTIDVVCVNLYPFKETVARPDVTYAEAIENIDIGGPTMLRSAAKNHAFVAVVVDPIDYDVVVNELTENGDVTLGTKRNLAAKVFRHTAGYDALVAAYLTEQVGETEPESITVTYTRKQSLRYGENPHQKATFYSSAFGKESSIASATQLHGKELSFNNIKDADAALAIVKEFDAPAVVAVKHMNPCGVGTGSSTLEAWERAYEADAVSIFGGIVACNTEVDAATALQMKEIFLEIILAPSFTEEALAILQEKKNLRLLQLPISASSQPEPILTSVHGGLLVQDEDVFGLEQAEIKVVTDREPTPEEWANLRLAWSVVKHVKSNAIVVAADQQTIGIGAGQMNRVGSARIALTQAGDRATGAVLASDAFFPMGDTVELAASHGISAIIQPGGSVRDQESIDNANKHGIAMIFTGIRHFKH